MGELKAKSFRIRFSKEFNRLDRKKADDFKKGVIIKRCRRFRDSDFKYLDELYHYEEKPASKSEQDNLDLYQRIINWRLAKSREEGIHAFLILWNSQIDLLIQNKPTTVRKLRKIKGIRKNIVREYGDEIISIINSINY